ncbi:MAG TPA: hypothetical protein VFW29_10020 [Solirubrobacteraceae bacterium]|nr:hypothetical protein [Solirubrobacteraceae bacterium]
MKLELLAPTASPEEAAAVVAALEQFMRATGRAAAESAGERDGWRETALLEGVLRDPDAGEMHPWINT